jgi:hypothetical protein
MKFLYSFLYLLVIYALLGPDPDSATQNTANPCKTLLLAYLEHTAFEHCTQQHTDSHQSVFVIFSSFNAFSAFIFHFNCRERRDFRVLRIKGMTFRVDSVYENVGKVCRLSFIKGIVQPFELGGVTRLIRSAVKFCMAGN